MLSDHPYSAHASVLLILPEPQVVVSLFLEDVLASNLFGELTNKSD